jgi:hypothetical protein
MIDLIYYMFYCSAGNDGTRSKHEMVAYGMEIVATQILSFFTFIIVGALNIKVSVFLLWILIIATNGVIAYLLVNRYYIKSGKYNKILEKYATTSNRKRTLYKTIVILLFIISFVLLFVGGIIMSYLFSLYE